MLTSLQARAVCVDVFGVGLRFPSMRGKIGQKKEEKKKSQANKKKTMTLPAHLEAMYARPKKGAPAALPPALPSSSSSTLPGFTLPPRGERLRAASPENSYMSVRVGE